MKQSMISPQELDKEQIQWQLLIKRCWVIFQFKDIQTWYYVYFLLFKYTWVSGNLEGIIDEGTYKTSIKNMHKLGWKAKYFKSADVAMLGHGFGVS